MLSTVTTTLLVCGRWPVILSVPLYNTAESCQTLHAVQNSAWPSRHWQLQANPGSPKTEEKTLQTACLDRAPHCVQTVGLLPSHRTGLEWPSRRYSVNRHFGHFCVTTATLTLKHKLLILPDALVVWLNSQLADCGHSLKEDEAEKPGFNHWLIASVAFILLSYNYSRLSTFSFAKRCSCPIIMSFMPVMCLAGS